MPTDGSNSRHGALNPTAVSWQGERATNEVEEEATYFLAAKDDHQESGEAHGGKGCDGICRCGFKLAIQLDRAARRVSDPAMWKIQCPTTDKTAPASCTEAPKTTSAATPRWSFNNWGKTWERC